MIKKQSVLPLYRQNLLIFSGRLGLGSAKKVIKLVKHLNQLVMHHGNALRLRASMWSIFNTMMIMYEYGKNGIFKMRNGVMLFSTH